MLERISKQEHSCHLTLKVSHEDGTSLSTVTFIPPPFSADTYLCNVTDLNCTSVPSYIFQYQHTDQLSLQKKKKNTDQPMLLVTPKNHVFQRKNE